MEIAPVRIAPTGLWITYSSADSATKSASTPVLDGCLKKLRGTVIRLGLETMAATGAYRLLAPLTGGIGVILMLHHVRPASPDAFQPNRQLEITPDFLVVALSNLRARGIDIVSLDEARLRLATRQFERRFAAC